MHNPVADLDPAYVEARRVLLDALTALRPHRDGVIVVGAQAIYLHTGNAELAVAPYTTDADLALDPQRLGQRPPLAAAMAEAGFSLRGPAGAGEPGAWVTRANIGGADVLIPVDLIVPEGASPAGGRRGARLRGHGKRVARRARGLEGSLIDHSTMVVSTLDRNDVRSAEAEVAGPAALLIAKAHKIHDRAETRLGERLNDKDAADVVRLMQTTRAEQIASVFLELVEHPMAAEPVADGLTYLKELFGRRGRPGIAMASRALRLGMPGKRVEAICVTFIDTLADAVRD
jgi:hypothetical protein